MKSNTEKITLQFLIKIFYNEFDNLFLNVKSFFIRAVMKFVIQQNCWIYIASSTVTKFSKDSEFTILSVKEAIKRTFQTSTFHSILMMINIKNFIYECTCFKTQLWAVWSNFTVKCCYNWEHSVRFSSQQ
jgi:hypothetical protein